MFYTSQNEHGAGCKAGGCRPARILPPAPDPRPLAGTSRSVQGQAAPLPLPPPCPFIDISFMPHTEGPLCVATEAQMAWYLSWEGAASVGQSG